jgi:uncharacterized protein
MVYKKSELKNLIGEFVKTAKKKMPLEQVILFGSYAYGKPYRASDIDLAVISPKFRNISDIDRINLLLKMAHKIKLPHIVDIEVLGFTPEEYKNPEPFTVLDLIKKKGETVYPVK